MHKSRVFTTNLMWTNGGILRNAERVNSVVIWQHNVLGHLPQIDVGDICVTSEAILPELTPGELALRRPFTIIHNGWTTPDTKYLYDNVADLEKCPFDGFNLRVAGPRDERGIVFNETTVSGSRQIVDMGGRAFQNVRFSPDAVEAAIQDLKATRSDKPRHNYIGITAIFPPQNRLGEGTQAVNMDWFDDAWWDTVNNNARLLARVAKQGGCEGPLVDPEEYLRGYIWTFSDLAADPRYAGKSFEDLAPLVRRRGRKFAQAVNSEYPGIHIVVSHAWETVLAEGALLGEDRLPEVVLSLLVPFLDGVLEGSDEKTVLIDGIEGGYNCETLSDFLAKARRLRREGPKLSAVPHLFRKKVRAGFGIYMNYGTYDPEHPERGFNRGTFDSAHPERNHWTPERLTNAVANALIAADGPVWVWNEWPSWLLDSPDARLAGGIEPRHPGWEKDKAVQYVPRVYWDALERARQKARAYINSQNN